MNTNKHLYINGEWVNGQGSLFSSYNPASGDIIWQGASAATTEITAAIAAAKAAKHRWAMTQLADRISIITQYAKILQHHKHRLAKCIAMEVGKPLWEALTEVSAMIDKIAISIKAYHDRSGVVLQDINQHHLAIRHKPHGIVAVLGPYNFPGHLPNGHIVPAILAGNCVVFKPSDEAPLVAEMMVECWQQAGLPGGVLNLLQGNEKVAKTLVSSHDIQAIYFTGSYATGVMLHKSFSGHPEKLLALEMGGNNPLVIDEVRDITAAAYLTILSAFITTGQRCSCARRLIIRDGSFGDEFLARLIALTKSVRIGHYQDKIEPFMGPVISAKAGKSLFNTQKALIRQGGVTLLSAKSLFDNEAFITPSIIDVTSIEQRKDEEYFGPLLQVIRVADLEAAIAEANNTRFGLAAGIFTDNADHYHLFYQQVNAGIVNWNCQLTGASSQAPFGGVGHSGNHRPSAYYAADYSAYPVASMENKSLVMPNFLPPGIMST